MRLFLEHSKMDYSKNEYSYDWHCFVNGEKVNLCLKSFAELHGFSKSRFECIAKVSKQSVSELKRKHGKPDNSVGGIDIVLQYYFEQV